MSKPDHKARKHALLSASGAHRWMACTPSARLEEEVGIDSTSVYAEEGTLAHELADIKLRQAFKMFKRKAEYNKALKKIESHELYQEEMHEHVDFFVDYVTHRYNHLKKISPAEPVVMIEQRIDLTAYIPEGFGTGDTCLVADKAVEVIDLKYGKGLRVDAEENEQLMVYGLGLLHKSELLYDIERVNMTIVQPRLDHVSTWSISVEDLFKWAEHLKTRAELAIEGEGEYVPGDHCKWCSAKHACSALKDFAFKQAELDFKPEQTKLTDDQIIEAYSQLSTILDYAKSLASHVETEAYNGKKWKGYKLVEGRSNRTWVAEDSAIDKLTGELKFEKDQVVNVKIKGIGDIEKLVGKKQFPALLGDYVDKPQGKPTLVPESDKRKEWSPVSAEEDFS